MDIFTCIEGDSCQNTKDTYILEEVNHYSEDNVGNVVV